MRTSVIVMILPCIAFVVLSGCGDGGRSQELSPASMEHFASSPTNQGTPDWGAHGWKGDPKKDDAVLLEVRREVERILANDLSIVPIARRHDAQCVRAEELWRNLDRIRTNDVEYVICSAARLQAIWEHDLATIQIPTRKLDRGPLYHTAEGIPYRRTTRERAKLANAEDREIAGTQSYLYQLARYAERYGNGIDSQFLWEMYRSLDEKARDEVLKRVTSILGRAPRWEKWQRR